MKRDWGVIREILRQLEDRASYGEAVRPDMIAGYDSEAVSYHMHLLDQAAPARAEATISPHW